MTGHVACTGEGDLAVVTLSNPRKFNDMTRAMWRVLELVLAWFME